VSVDLDLQNKWQRPASMQTASADQFHHQKSYGPVNDGCANNIVNGDESNQYSSGIQNVGTKSWPQAVPISLTLLRYMAEAKIATFYTKEGKN